MSWNVTKLNIFVIIILILLLIVSRRWSVRIAEQMIHESSSLRLVVIRNQRRSIAAVSCKLLLDASFVQRDAISLFALIAILSPGWQVCARIRIMVERRRWLIVSRSFNGLRPVEMIISVGVTHGAGWHIVCLAAELRVLPIVVDRRRIHHLRLVLSLNVLTRNGCLLRRRRSWALFNL